MASPKSHRGPAGSKPAARGRRPLLLRRAMLHSCLCFLLGLFSGLAPSDWTDAASRAASTANAAATAQVFRALHAVRAINSTTLRSSSSRSHHRLLQQPSPTVVVAVTTTGLSERERRSAGLTRTAHALRLVSPPVVWLVVEDAREAPATALLLRRTGLVYRHVTYNLSDHEDHGELHHLQRNLALAHIEQHRLRGVVLFAGLADVYDIRLLDQLRTIGTFAGAWPVATVWEKRVAVEGPVCSSINKTAAGWFSIVPTPSQDSFSDSIIINKTPRLPDVDVHGFAFCTDLLWDPARWDRFPTSEPDQSQDSIKFVQRLLVEDYDKTRPMPPDANCSEIMAWRVDAALL